MKILVCLAHELTVEQKVEMGEAEITSLKHAAPDLFGLLSNCSDDTDVLTDAADRLIAISEKFDATILPIGSPMFMFILSSRLSYGEKKHYYFAHSVRESVDSSQPDGSVKKQSVFKHVRFFNMHGKNLEAKPQEEYEWVSDFDNSERGY